MESVFVKAYKSYIINGDFSLELNFPPVAVELKRKITINFKNLENMNRIYNKIIESFIHHKFVKSFSMAQ